MVHSLSSSDSINPKDPILEVHSVILAVTIPSFVEWIIGVVVQDDQLSQEVLG